MMSDDKKYVYKSTLKKVYGLTDKLIRQLGSPDKIVPNPHYRGAAPSSLYLIERVEEWIENHPGEMNSAMARSRAMKDIAEIRRLETLAWANSVSVIVNEFEERKELEKQTLNAAWHQEDFILTENAIIAFVRHNRTNYHDLLATLSGLIGCAEAYVIIKRRVNDEITKRLVEASCQN